MTATTVEKETYSGGNYSVTAAARLVGLPRSRASRYAREHGGADGPLGKQKWGRNRYLRFLDLMELRTANEMAKIGVPWTKISKVADYAAWRLDQKYPMSSKKFLMDGYEVIFRESGLTELTYKGGRYAFPEMALKLKTPLDYDIKENLVSWTISEDLGMEEEHPILIRPGVALGAPTLENPAVPTNIIYRMWIAESKNTPRIAEEWGITCPQVLAACNFEERIQKRNDIFP